VKLVEWFEYVRQHRAMLRGRRGYDLRCYPLANDRFGRSWRRCPAPLSLSRAELKVTFFLAGSAIFRRLPSFLLAPCQRSNS
jgi:hypothetical protein